MIEIPPIKGLRVLKCKDCVHARESVRRGFRFCFVYDREVGENFRACKLVEVREGREA